MCCNMGQVCNSFSRIVGRLLVTLYSLDNEISLNQLNRVLFLGPGMGSAPGLVTYNRYVKYNVYQMLLNKELLLQSVSCYTIQLQE